jgi:cyclic-di-GMP phosphodiesterase TipF (flagellum assembly factor)
MNKQIHLILAAAYVAAGFVGMIAGWLGSGEFFIGLVTGALIVMLGGLSHEFVIRRDGFRRMLRGIVGLRDKVEQMERGIDGIQKDIGKATADARGANTTAQQFQQIQELAQKTAEELAAFKKEGGSTNGLAQTVEQLQAATQQTASDIEVIQNAGNQLHSEFMSMQQQLAAQQQQFEQIHATLAQMQGTMNTLAATPPPPAAPPHPDLEPERIPAQPAAAAPPPEQAVMEQPVMEQPPMQEPAPPPPVQQQPMEQPPEEQPAMEEAAMEEAAMEEPAMEQPAMEQPAMEQPVAPQPAAEQPPQPEMEQPAPTAAAASGPAAAALQQIEAHLSQAGGEGAVDVTLRAVAEALRTDAVDLYLEPIVTLPERKPAHFECHGGVRGPDGAALAVDPNLDPMGREELMTAIENGLLARCLDRIAAIDASGLEGGACFYNVAGVTLGDRAFFGGLIGHLQANPGLAQRLVLEFPQSALMEYGEQAVEDLVQIQETGCRFSIDAITDLEIDFESLAGFGFRFVKVGSKFMRVQANTADDPETVRGLAKTLKAIGIDVVVENVETDLSLVELIAFDITLGQGPLFGTPALMPYAG